MSGTGASGTPSSFMDGPAQGDKQQFGRLVSLKIGSATDRNDALDLSDFRFTFTVTRDSVKFPNSIRLQIYNLSDATAKKIQKEYSRVFLQAGYPGSFGTIFDGTVIKMMRGAAGVDPDGYLHDGPPGVFLRRENPTDTFLDITALDGDLLFNFATIHITLAAGSTPHSQLTAIRNILQANGSDLKYFGSFTTGKDSSPAIRGMVLHGQVRDYLDKFCETHACTWSIQDNVVEIVPNNTYIRNNLIVLSSLTGLIGLPQQTLNGIEFTALLNPYLRVNRAVRISNEVIQQVVPPYGYGQIDNVQPLNGQGLYRILYYQHIGDTRGNAWYTKCIAIGINQAGVAPGSGAINYYSG